MKLFLAKIARYALWIIDSLVKRERISLWGIFILALFIRLAYMYFTGRFSQELVYDEIGYDLLANSLLNGQGFGGIVPGWLTASRVPGYPLFLVIIYSVSGHNPLLVKIIQTIIGSLTCVFIYILCRDLFSQDKEIHKRVALLAGLVSSVYPLFFYMNALMYSETLALFLMVIATLTYTHFIQRGGMLRAFLAGCLMMAASLTLPLTALLVPLLILGLLVVGGLRKGIVSAVVMSAGVVLVLTPWVTRNYLVFQRFVPLSSLAGSNFWSGNNPLADGGFVLPTEVTWNGDQPPDLEYLGWSNLGEIDSGPVFMRAAINWIQENPVQFLTLLPKKVMRLLSPTSYGRQFSRAPTMKEIALIAPPYFIFLLLAIYGVYLGLSYWPYSLALYAAVISCILAALLYYGATRYSMSMAPSLIIFSCLAIIVILQKLSAKTSNQAA